MSDAGDVPERPATVANEAVGEAKKLFGRVTGDEELEQEGEDQTEIAHEVHDEFTAEHHPEEHR
jgi:uncharacterized protein YjbJ (UPF0337 family)